MPPYEVRTLYIDWHLAAFPDTPLVMLVGDLTQVDSDTLAYAVSRGTGWRADCWGDYRSPSNHMEDDYPIKLATPGVSDAWRTHPVAKSSMVPEPWVDALAEFTAHIGYRFALASTPAIPSSVARGATARVTLTWTNSGNAPIYRTYALAVRLLQGGTEVARGISTTDVKTWMPRSTDGVDYTTDIDLAVAADTPAGPVTVQAALLDSATNAPARAQRPAHTACPGNLLRVFQGLAGFRGEIDLDDF